MDNSSEIKNSGKVKNIIASIAFVIIAACLINIFWLRIHASIKNAERLLERDKEELYTIVSFFEKCDIDE